MFWQSVFEGVLKLFDWHILVGILLVSTLPFIVSFSIFLIYYKRDVDNPGCLPMLFMFFAQSVVQVFAVAFFILFCFPAMIGDGGYIPLDIVGKLWWPIVKLGTYAMLIVISITIIPVIGNLVANTPGVTIFLQGIFIIKPFTERYLAAFEYNLPNEAFPGIWQCIGYIVIGGIFCYILIIIITLLEMCLEKKGSLLGYRFSISDTNPLRMAVFFGTGAVVGILPLLIYTRYIAIFLRG